MRWLGLAAIATWVTVAGAQIPDTSQIPSYKPSMKVAGAIRVYGADLKRQMVIWEHVSRSNG